MVGASGQVLGESTGAIPWDAIAVADDATDSLDIQVTGNTGTNVRWVAVVRTAKVSY